MEPWWLWVDRSGVLGHLRSLVPYGGAAVLVGDSKAGRPQVAALAERFFSRFGYECSRVSIGLSASDAKPVLLTLWRELAEEPEVDEIAPWAWHASSMSARELLERIVEVLKDSDASHAVIIEELDRDGRATGKAIKWLEELTEVSSLVLVITGCEESGTDWENIGVERLVKLSYFSRDDIRECLIRTPVFSDWPADRIEQELDEIVGDHVSENIPPSSVYTHLVEMARKAKVEAHG